ncbi:MAG TPA: Sec-independent protein translocase protein TatB [Polyangiaceae bacterium]|nr:Sec-independent protein translocase protein TatB [Polyangiaceae bacterium]
MFGFSFSELLMICVVALIAVGPKKLPGMLHSLGQFIRKIRNMTNDVRNQTGIDQLLRAEGLHGGLNELRGLLRVNHGLSFDAPFAPTTPNVPSEPAVMAEPNGLAPTATAPIDDPYAHIDIDSTREYPPEGADAYGALPDDLLPYEPSEPAKTADQATAEATTGAAPTATTGAAPEASGAAPAATTEASETTPDATAEATTPSA